MMKQSIFGIAAAAMIATAPTAFAEPHCTPTAHTNASHYPGADVIPPSNNLLQPSGKATPVEGQKLVISGHLLDSHCIPIAEAVVELWQADPYGHYFLAEDGDRVNSHPAFAGAGRTVTDADGLFTFITAFPGATTSKGTKKHPATAEAPHVNIRIKAEGFTPTTAVFYFANDRRNADDTGYGKLTPEQKSGTTLIMNQGADGNLYGGIEFVLPGTTPYRTY